MAVRRWSLGPRQWLAASVALVVASLPLPWLYADACRYADCARQDVSGIAIVRSVVDSQMTIGGLLVDLSLVVMLTAILCAATQRVAVWASLAGAAALTAGTVSLLAGGVPGWGDSISIAPRIGCLAVAGAVVCAVAAATLSRPLTLKPTHVSSEQRGVVIYVVVALLIAGGAQLGLSATRGCYDICGVFSNVDNGLQAPSATPRP